ncbi:MAG: putative glycosyltransferase [Acidimicrobiales bacterium]|nr:putative glycosyltransferase [Acidimicrobiales bacterium]
MTGDEPARWEPDLRILSINPEFPVVSEPFVQDRLAALAERGHEVRVLARAGSAQLDAAVARQGERLKQLSVPARARVLGVLAALCTAFIRDPWFVVRLVARLRRMHPERTVFWRELSRLLPLAGYAADVVHFEWLNDATHHLELLDILPGVKVASSQGSDLRVAPHISSWVGRRLPPTLRALDGLHCVSQDLAEIAATYGADPARTAVIPNGVDTAYFSTDAYPRRRVDADDFRVISVGRLNWVKGYDYALHAVRILLDRGHDIRYTILGGDDGDGYALQLAIRDLGLDGHVHLAGQGPRFRVRALLANADAFLLPSVSEGTSVALLEAMAMTLPVVATDVGGTKEVVRHEEHGLLVPPRDPPAMADALERLMSDGAWSRGMGERAAERIRQDYDAGRAIDDLVAFYVRVVPSWRLPHRPSSAP